METIFWWSIVVIVACVALFTLFGVGYFVVSFIFNLIDEIRWQRKIRK